MISTHPTHLTSFTAWSVSLNPNKETYAATGASGNVAIRSAKAANFGEKLGSLSSGRNKFGMACAHVRIPCDLKRNKEPN